MRVDGDRYGAAGVLFDKEQADGAKANGVAKNEDRITVDGHGSHTVPLVLPRSRTKASWPGVQSMMACCRETLASRMTRASSSGSRTTLVRAASAWGRPQASTRAATAESSATVDQIWSGSRAWSGVKITSRQVGQMPSDVAALQTEQATLGSEPIHRRERRRLASARGPATGVRWAYLTRRFAPFDTRYARLRTNGQMS